MKRGPEHSEVAVSEVAVSEVVVSDFPLQNLLDEILSGTVFPFLDLSSLHAMSQTNKRFNALIESKWFWQQMVDKYFPHIKETNLDSFNSDPKYLFIKEFKYLQSSFPKISIKYFLSAMNGKIQETTDPEIRKSLLPIMLSHGFYSVLNLEEVQPEDIKKSLVNAGILLAAFIDNVKVFDTLAQHPLVEKKEAFRGCFAVTLSQGRVVIANHILEIYLKKINISEKEILEILNYTLKRFNESDIDITQWNEERIIAMLGYIVKFKQENEMPKVELYQLERALLKAVEQNSIHLVEYLLSLKDSSGNAFLFNPDAIQGFFRVAARNNHAQMFKYLYQKYQDRLLLPPPDGIGFAPEIFDQLIKSAASNHENTTTELVEFLVELKDENNTYYVHEEALVASLEAAVKKGKHQLVQYLLNASASKDDTLIVDIVDLVDLIGICNVKNLSTIEVLLNSAKSHATFNQCYMIFLTNILRGSEVNPINTLASIKDNNGKPFSLNSQTMLPLLVMLPTQEIVENQHVADFAKSLSTEDFNEAKTVLKFHHREDIGEELENIRAQIDLVSAQTTLVFSSRKANADKNEETEVKEPPAKIRKAPTS